MKKLRDQSGFSLVESLCAVIVLLLVSAVIMTGSRLAADTFSRSVSVSEAQVLCSTLKTVIADELRSTGTVFVDESGYLEGIFSTHYGISAGNMSSFGAVSHDGSPAAVGELTLGGEKLLSSSAYTYGARASVSVSYAEEENCFTATLTVYDGEGREIKTTEFDVMPVKAPAVNRVGAG